MLGLLVAEALLTEHPDVAVGPLTERRAGLVSTRGLAAWADRLGLGPVLHLGRGEDQGGGRMKESVLATALEAVVGALYLDGGLDPARRLVGLLMDSERAARG